MSLVERSLGLAGAPNARDLGGLPCGNGAVIRPGVLLRAPALGRLTDADVDRLGGYGLRDLLDLRHGSEIEIEPPDRLPAGLHVAHIPIFDPTHPVFRYVSAVLMGREPGPDFDPGTDGSPAAMVAIYRWFIEAPAARAGFATAVSRIAQASGPLIFHCSAGKDRTGWLSAILLTALGADRATITADYLLTNEHTADIGEAILAAAENRRGVPPERLRPLLAAAPEYLTAAFDAAQRDYGSMDGYLRDGLGVTDETVTALRDRLL